MSDEHVVHGLNQSRQAVLKAMVVGTRTQSSASLQGDEAARAAFTSAGVLEPPYDAEALCVLCEHSNSLRQNVDAYATNIDGFGHRFEPAIDLNAPDARQQVEDSLYLEQIAAEDRGGLASETAFQVGEEEVAARLKELQRLSRVERARLEAFFDFCCFDHSFVDLRRRTRQDLEVTGNAFWELLRDARGEVARLVYVPSHSVRLLPLDEAPTEITERMRVSAVSYETVITRRRLRRYVQFSGTSAVYFKGFGDPRVVSRETGESFAGMEALLEADADDGPATELLHFAIHSPRTPYGVPRWIGTLLSVLGSRQMEEVNYLYFENKSVPPMALLVSGGRLSESSVPRIERFIEEHLKGKKNFHKILILEAEGGSGASDAARAKIELRPLTEAQLSDGLFQHYDERNIDKVGSAFRLPRMLRGESKDFNRATAQSALRFAEDQVFQPERDSFDYLINRKLLADMGVRFWRFRSQTPITRDPERTSAMVVALVKAGVLTPEEGRQLSGDIFNREFRRLGDDWTKRPITLTLAGVQTQRLDLGADAERLGGVQKLQALHTQLLNEEGRLAKVRLERAKDAEEEMIRVVVPDKDFLSWFEGGPNDAG